MQPAAGDAGPRFTPEAARRVRRANLTPMVDVLFLLVVFFLLAARFEATGALPLTAGGGGAEGWTGPPRLVTVTPDALRLNGVDLAGDALAPALAALMQGPDDPVVIRAGGGATVQRLVDVVSGLRAAGITRLMLAD
ncbi:MAG: biopolymer transporter ExbD [Gemmobacter sp.]